MTILSEQTTILLTIMCSLRQYCVYCWNCSFHCCIYCLYCWDHCVYCWKYCSYIVLIVDVYCVLFSCMVHCLKYCSCHCLFIVYCYCLWPLFRLYCLIYCLLYCLLFIVYCLLLVLLFIVYCLLFIVCFIVYLIVEYRYCWYCYNIVGIVGPTRFSDATNSRHCICCLILMVEHARNTEIEVTTRIFSNSCKPKAQTNKSST